MVFIVVVEPPGNQSEDSDGVWQRRLVHVVALERIHEGRATVCHRFEDDGERYAIALRALYRCVTGLQAELPGEDAGILGDVGGAVVAAHVVGRRGRRSWGLRAAIADDRANGIDPACVIATAGTVNTGSIDDLEAIADLCSEEGLWLHVDGCIGALLAIAPEGKALVRGIARADSIALDPHKWLHAPFEVGCALVRDAGLHRGTFTVTPEYLETAPRGIASGEWLHDFGLQTSRGFRALKVWMALKEHGVAKFGRLIEQDLEHARYLTERIGVVPDLELCFPTNINIVCFRYDPGEMTEPELKRLNTEIMVRLQETGIAAISDTTVHGRHCLRAAINNHRTTRDDLDVLVEEVVRLGTDLNAHDAHFQS